MIVLLLGLLIVGFSSFVLVPVLDDPEESRYDRVVTALLVAACLTIVYLVAVRAAEAFLA